MKRFLRRSHTHRKSDVAEVIARCAAVLRGGVPATRVFGHLGAEVGAQSAIREIDRRVGSGASVAEAIAAEPGEEWKLLAAAWNLAGCSGSPLGPVLDRMVVALRSIETLSERRSVLLAGPRATVRLVLALPPVALGLGWLLGFDPSPVLFSMFGAVLICVGVLLLVGGALWTSTLTRHVEEADHVAGLEFDLVWIALGAGRTHQEAVRSVIDSVDQFRAHWVPFDAFLAESDLQVTLRRACAIGAPVRPTLLDAADTARLRSLAGMERAAERLGVRILMPLGVCVLPAFMVMGVLPVVISMLNGSQFVG